jgi:hypothetical protein
MLKNLEMYKIYLINNIQLIEWYENISISWAVILNCTENRLHALTTFSAKNSTQV